MSDIIIETSVFTVGEIHILTGDFVEESNERDAQLDFLTEFADTRTSFVYFGPALPAVDGEWSTDAWFRNDGWFGEEAW